MNDKNLKFLFDHKLKTTCRFCLNYCGMIVSKVGEKLKIQGDPDHPLSKGFLCAKGRSAIDIITSPARILHPLVKCGERGSGVWKRISWGEAIERIAAQLVEIRDAYGAEAIAVECLPPKDYQIWEAFAKVIGTPSFFKHDAHNCFTPQFLADYSTFGSLVTYPNFTEADAQHVNTLVLWGINPTETNPSKGAVFEKARKKAKVVVIDPRPIPFARRADIWLRVRPGSDAALALGMLHYIVERGLYDHNFVGKWSVGFEELRERLKQYPLDKVSRLTWVEEGKIKAAAELMALNKPTAIFTFIGLTMNGNGFDTLRCLGLLVALLGCIDVLGGNAIKIPPAIVRRGFEGEKAFKLSESVLGKQISAKEYPLLSGESALTPYPHPWDFVDAMLTGKPYPIKALLTACNPITSLEDGEKVLRAFKNLDLLVVFELFVTPTAEFADFLLPITSHLETDAVTIYTGMNFIVARNKCLEPLGEARDETEVLLEILRKMGLANNLPFKTKDEYLNYLLEPAGLSFKDLRKAVYLLKPYEERKYEKGLLRPDGKPGFNTPSGKVELSSNLLRSYGYDPLPLHREPPLSPYSTPELVKDYPYVLVTGVKTLAHYNGLGLQIPKLRGLRPYPLLEISPGAAKNLGLEEGSWAYVEVPTSANRVKMKIHIVDGLDDRVVCTKGLWYLPEEADQEKRIWGANINKIVPNLSSDPILKTSSARALLCKVYSA